MQPQHGTLYIRSSRMQSIPIPQINRRHANPLPSLVPRVILLNLANPVVAHLLFHIFAEANVNQEIRVLLAGLEIRCRSFGGEFVLDGLA